MNNEYKCVLSLGIRCFTEIYLKQLNYKKFSSPFDALYLSSINDIIYLLKNKINKADLVHTEDDERYKLYNRDWPPPLPPPNGWGCRTIHTKLDNTLFDPDKYTHSSYHHATFAHHNLKNIEVFEHFKRCFERFDIIQEKKIKTLFCLFIHPKYCGYIKISTKDIKRLSVFLQERYNCHLLVIFFLKTNIADSYSLLKGNENYTIYKINNNASDFLPNKNVLLEIFHKYNINESQLLKYKEISEYPNNE